MELVKAGIEDFDNILKVYGDIIAHTPKMDTYARWKEGLHPTEAAIREYIEQDAMYLYTDGKDIAGVMAVTMEQGEDYNQIQWAITTKDDEVAVIHLLGISPAWQHKGIGTQMINQAMILVFHPLINSTF
jgi:GNAT superfamily N-acetyltransferase